MIHDTLRNDYCNKVSISIILHKWGREEIGVGLRTLEIYYLSNFQHT